ncbi:NAD-dependent epimerase/dehydratase family protein [Bradyrhizobium sp.]
MRVVVTGAGGFIGWHTVDALLTRGDAVQAWSHGSLSADWGPAVEAVKIDITDGPAVDGRLKQFMPDAVIHLAALSLPQRSWEDPVSTYQVNVIGSIHLLEAVRRLTPMPRLLVVGSSAEYAEPADGRLIAEDAPIEPNSPYASSKLAVDQLAQLFARRYRMDIIRFRPFSFIGPRKTGDVCSDFARRLVAIERGAQPVMRVGSLDVVRDMIDVRDGVSGIMHLMDKGRSGEMYNVCGGSSVSIGDILDGYRRLSTVPFEVKQDASLIRALEQKVKIGNSGKLRALGWKLEHDLADTLDAILNYWRRQPNATLA